MRITLAYPLLLPILGLAAATLAAPPSEPPRARSIRHEEVRHGETVRDDYYWLREKANPEVIRYLEAENAYTAAVTESLKPLVETIYKEIKGRLKETDLSVPAREGAFYYYTRTEEGRQYAIHCRKAAKADGGFDEAAAEEILIDGNELATGQTFLSIGVKAVSDDGTRLAYTTDVVGFRQFTLYFKDLATGTTAKLAERVTTLAWAADNATLFYTTEDAATKRSDTLWRLKTGGRPEKVYVENDPAFDLYVSRTRDKAFVRLLAQSFDAWETRLLDATRPAGKFRTLLARENGHKYEVESRQGMLYIRTNRGAPDFRVVTAPAADPRPEKWRPFVAGEPGTLVDDIEVFEGGAAVFEKANAQDRVRLYDFARRAWRTVNFSEAVYAVTPVDLADFASPQVRVSFQSPVTPPTVIDIDLASGRQTVRKRQEVLGGYDASRYQTARLWATARDGAKVPLSVVWRKETPRDGSAPMLLYGYGSYGIGMPATFRSVNISLLDRGVVYAIAHVRGGNELGEGWYEAGRLMNKKNTFNDFIDCAEYLIAEKWSNPKRLAIEGGSAGGLLMGAVTNMRPELFRAVHAAVPFLDVMNSMWDETLPLTTQEYTQWGDPQQKPAYDYMRSYSPYDNIGHKAYPAMLLTTSMNDSQVMYWEPAKYVAKLRAFKTDANPLLLKTTMTAGHAGASGRYDAMQDRAFEVAWLLSQLGVGR